VGAGVCHARSMTPYGVASRTSSRDDGRHIDHHLPYTPIRHQLRIRIRRHIRRRCTHMRLLTHRHRCMLRRQSIRSTTRISSRLSGLPLRGVFDIAGLCATILILSSSSTLPVPLAREICDRGRALEPAFYGESSRRSTSARYSLRSDSGSRR
jgi:hypothetical protein